MLDERISRRELLVGTAGLGLVLSGCADHSKPTPVPAPHIWEIRSVDMQKETQDALKAPVPEPYIKEIVQLAKDVHATHIAIGVPYDTPPTAQIDAVEYARQWTRAARDSDLNIWHRHMPTQFEGFYDQEKVDQEYYTMIREYILSNHDLFADGDIFAPFPEPQNGGVEGINCQEEKVDDCQFDSVDDFNEELRSYVEVCREAFTEIGKDVRVGYYGLDGFVVAGLNNPDRKGQTFLEPKTVEILNDTLALDHYTDEGAKGYEEDYELVHEIFPHEKIVIGELGPASHLPDNPSQEEVNNAFDQTLDALSHLDWIIGVNMYPFISGKPHESLIWVDEERIDNPNFSISDAFITTPQYDIVQKYFLKMAGTN